MYNGECLCGQIRFRITGAIKDIVCCHCSLCRKAQGSAYATNGNVEKAHFVFDHGEDLLTSYEAAPGHHKLFCRLCGSPVLSSNTADPVHVRVRLGTITSAISDRPVAHIHVDSKADWEQIAEGLPQFGGNMTK